ncbi:Pkinase-domain-containing protein [Mycena amicta]|nr:Pkinase-domain-containing protein [Mycena amicta]
MPPATVPCQYRTGKTLGSGTYAIVKEAIHIKTGKYYACKVINKKLMEGREHMVRNEIAVLKRISSGNPQHCDAPRLLRGRSISRDTSHNLYLCFDLCTGGELFDRICARGNYYEADAADLLRTIFTAVAYIHAAGIEADIMIADFGLSRIMEEEKLSMLTEVCGTPGYMAPEIFLKTGHSKPVDVWALGVVTYFLLAGYTPFDRDTPKAEMEAIIAGEYRFEPVEYWENVSETARDFWLASSTPHFVSSPTGGPTDLLPHVKKAFDAKRTWKKAAFSIRALSRMTLLAGTHPLGKEAQELSENVRQYKEESEKEVMEDASIMHHHLQDGSPLSPSPLSPSSEVAAKLQHAHLG